MALTQSGVTEGGITGMFHISGQTYEVIQEHKKRMESGGIPRPVQRSAGTV